MNSPVPEIDTDKRRFQVSIKTTKDNLTTIAQLSALRELSQLSLPEINAVVDVVARVIPAGNVPGVILNGLARLPGRKPPPDALKRDVNMLFRGVEQVLDKAVYTTFFAGPAAVIWGYQNLLKLAGKNPEDSFPDGTWQFYAEYALREDTARHTSETHGFDTRLDQHGINLSAVDRITAWIMTAIHTLHQYNDLLENEWRERVYINLLREVVGSESENQEYTGLYGKWRKQIPYGRGSDADSGEAYPEYRRRKFDYFFETVVNGLSTDLRRLWLEQVRAAKTDDLAAYLSQMSILAYLEPGAYGETRTAIPLEKVHIGVIRGGHYYLVPACQPGTTQPADVNMVRKQVAAIFEHPSDKQCIQLSEWAHIRRNALLGLREQLNADFVNQLDLLRLAPILLNCDPRPHDLPLSELRQTERGTGDHALTLFDTGKTMVFDQSHIFFDGGWGAALAEIMTNEALSWARYLITLPSAKSSHERPYSLALQLEPSELELVRQAPRTTAEVGTESGKVSLKRLLALRKLFKQRSDLLQLTVNDLLILYRAIHAVTYQPSPQLIVKLQTMMRDKTHGKATQAAIAAALDVLDSGQQVNPAILIPVDAGQRSPRDRLYPMSIEVPLADLDLLNIHNDAVAALDTYENASGDRSTFYTKFDDVQRTYLATLAGFGEVMTKAKEIANAGESVGVGAVKLLAHMPQPLQQLLDKIPGRFDVLNDIIKGREVFSNVGAVAPTSTLMRFITAKDDNDKKTLAWGVVTDAKGVMHISLRDFRPHVGLLIAVGQKNLATNVAWDYLDAYVQGFNTYIRELRRITGSSRETRTAMMEGNDE